ncbi:MAG: YHYH domain-containing protein [Alphaproteobacteria bacterium GM7ARS4]|nr:YHYH domain-containing protein [Alphaproteobacteria bacterium GM7ARS4]
MHHESVEAVADTMPIAHSGGTNASNCHCDRRYGGCVYHCH